MTKTRAEVESCESWASPNGQPVRDGDAHGVTWITQFGVGRTGPICPLRRVVPGILPATPGCALRRPGGLRHPSAVVDLPWT